LEKRRENNNARSAWNDHMRWNPAKTGTHAMDDPEVEFGRVV